MEDCGIIGKKRLNLSGMFIKKVVCDRDPASETAEGIHNRNTVAEYVSRADGTGSY